MDLFLGDNTLDDFALFLLWASINPGRKGGVA